MNIPLFLSGAMMAQPQEHGNSDHSATDTNSYKKGSASLPDANHEVPLGGGYKEAIAPTGAQGLLKGLHFQSHYFDPG